MSRLFLVVLLGVVTLLACVSRHTQLPTLIQYEVYNGLEYVPPVSYYRWWSEILSCAEDVLGRSLPYKTFEQLRWVAADSIKTRKEGVKVSGLWASGTIYVDKSLFHFKSLIQHEMLHHIMWPITHGDWEFVRCDPLS
jgi:hypothetical protein